MRSSTSSSEHPPLAWKLLLGGALAALLLAVAGTELALAARDLRPSVLDAETPWLRARARAATLGKGALLLVGDSRMQLDIDQDVLRHETGLEPVQLALNGTPFIGVFRGLAEDPHITGTLLVSFALNGVAYPREFERQNGYEQDAERLEQGLALPDFAIVDSYLAGLLHQELRSYADGAQPLHNLYRTYGDPDARPQYLVTLPDRSTLADYSRVKMPEFYYQRTSLELGQQGKVPPGNDASIQAYLRSQIAALRPEDPAYFQARVAEVADMAARITARGGRVIFILFPESGLVRDIDDRRYPRAQFWDRFAASGVAALDYEDVPALKAIRCPDGSHLDYHDRASFTRELVAALGLTTRTPAP